MPFRNSKLLLILSSLKTYLSGSSWLNHSITEGSCSRPGSRVWREGEGTHRLFRLFGFQLKKSRHSKHILFSHNDHLFCWYR